MECIMIVFLPLYKSKSHRPHLFNPVFMNRGVFSSIPFSPRIVIGWLVYFTASMGMVCLHPRVVYFRVLDEFRLIAQ